MKKNNIFYLVLTFVYIITTLANSSEKNFNKISKIHKNNNPILLIKKANKLDKSSINLADNLNEFTLNAVIPKIFTPEEINSLINNIKFYFENPNFVEVTIRIFDINGAVVMKNLRREGENVMVWDGKDINGDIVKGGIYIYQVEAENKIINGTIVVAK